MVAGCRMFLVLLQAHSIPRAVCRSVGFQGVRRNGFSNSNTIGGIRTRIDRRWFTGCFSSSQADEATAISSQDLKYMSLAANHAREGLGHTFPNPAVGCVLVRQDTSEIIGSGFHPRAGMPHAEVFALFEACGHVPDTGVKAAQSAMPQSETTTTSSPDGKMLADTVLDLTQTYMEKGPLELFGNAFSNFPVTAYVTLEPCCHYGKTPPCAASLAAAKVNRVVVGFRDPNPRVDGGGVQLLRENEVHVDLLSQDSQEQAQKVAAECAALVENFVKRISPQARKRGDYSHINGAKRSALRSLSGRQKTEGTLAQVTWPETGESVRKADFDDLERAVDELPLDPSWMESLDAELWSEELVLVRLNQAIAKKKGAKRLGERIAAELDAHVAQVLGHTVLLFRSGLPPVLELSELVERMKK